MDARHHQMLYLWTQVTLQMLNLWMQVALQWNLCDAQMFTDSKSRVQCMNCTWPRISKIYNQLFELARITEGKNRRLVNFCQEASLDWPMTGIQNVRVCFGLLWSKKCKQNHARFWTELGYKLKTEKCKPFRDRKIWTMLVLNISKYRSTSHFLWLLVTDVTPRFASFLTELRHKL